MMYVNQCCDRLVAFLASFHSLGNDKQPVQQWIVPLHVNSPPLTAFFGNQCGFLHLEQNFQLHNLSGAHAHSQTQQISQMLKHGI